MQTDDPQNVTTGLEFSIPLSQIGNPTGNIKLTAFVNGGGHNYSSNQVFGGGCGFAAALARGNYWHCVCLADLERLSTGGRQSVRDDQQSGRRRYSGLAPCRSRRRSCCWFVGGSLAVGCCVGSRRF